MNLHDGIRDYDDELSKLPRLKNVNLNAFNVDEWLNIKKNFALECNIYKPTSSRLD